MRTWFTLLAAWLAVALASPCSAEQQQYAFEIPREPLVEAIRSFSNQTNLQLGYLPETPADESILVGPLQGTFTADAALIQLLRPSGLAHEWINDRTVYIVKPRSAAAADSGESQSTTTTDESGASRPAGRRRSDAIEFVIVTGTRLSSIAAESAAVEVINRQKIESYGVATLAELVAYLPQMPFMRSEEVRASGEQYADLRGLGPGTTLILINGKRVAATATSFDNAAFDINSIPLTAVQRIEVRLDSPSIAEGTDAMGGIINIILKEDIPDPIVELRYGSAAGGAAERRASVGLGTSQERFSGAATLDVFHRGFLLGVERDLSRNQDYRRFGGLDMRSVDAMPGNIMSLTSENLPGLNSRLAAVPAASSGVGLTPEDFIATTDELNKASLRRFRSIVPESSRITFIGSAEVNLSEQVNAFSDFVMGKRTNERQNAPATLMRVPIPASNAFNPFGVPVAVNVLLDGMAPRTINTEADLIRAVAGLRARWELWEAELTAMWTQEHSKFWMENELDPARVTEALASSDPANALNVFRDGPVGSSELLASLAATPRIQKNSSDAVQGHAQVHGPLFELLAGDATAIFGSEWRREGISHSGLTQPFLPATALHRTIAAAFGEVQLPIVNPVMQISAIHELSVTAGTRMDDFGGLDAIHTPQYGLVWRPLADLKLRASYSTSYRAPTLVDLYFPLVTIPASAPDPHRHNEIASFVLLTGGNADLIPSTGRTWTVGLELTPSLLPNLNVVITYWDTTVVDRIAPNIIPLFIGREDVFGDRIQRAERTARDIELGVPGALQSVDVSPGNFGRLEVNGVDLNVALSFETNLGRFSPNLSATWTRRFTNDFVAGLLSQQRVGIADEQGTIPRWRAVGSVGWTRGSFSFFSAIRFNSAYDDALLGIRTGRSVPVQILTDVQASTRLDELTDTKAPWQRVKLTVGATNVFDEGPHFAEFGRDWGYDPSQGDPKQRFWYLQLVKEF